MIRYLATQANDEPAKERIAAKWRQMYNAPGLTAASVTCDGCIMPGRKGGPCAEFDMCGKLAGFFCAAGKNDA